MQEFSSISVSTYDPDALVGHMNDKSTDGWNVVAIVPTGSTITAYLSRDGVPGTGTDDAAADTASESGGTGIAAAIIPEPAPEPAEPVTAAEPAQAPAEASAEPSPFEPNLPGAPAAAVPEPVAEPAAEPAAQASQPTAASAAAPAGWYADPSSRFELRYWDGGTWTEHVSRAGQQYTDPPVA